MTTENEFTISEIIRSPSEEQMDEVRKLFREYEAWLDLDLCFQNFEKELEELPGDYAPPNGRLLLVYHDSELAGCVALRKIGDGICEMKRLFVRDRFRGKGLGRTLTAAIIREGRTIGYQRMRLDTIPPKMNDAIALYRRLGFREIAPYYNNPVPGPIFMELEL